MMNLLRATLCALVSLLVLAPGLSAQTPDAAPRSPLGVTAPSQPGAEQSGRSPAITGIASRERTEPGLFSRFSNWVLATQQSLNRQLATAVKQLKEDNPILALSTLLFIAFGYGVLHAAGPGHGKAVISSYVLANDETLRRGIALSFLSAAFQALSAILFVGLLAIILRKTSIEMRATEAWTETISWALIAALGAYLIYRQAAAVVKNWNKPEAVGHEYGDHGHHHHEHHGSAHYWHDHNTHDHDHAHGNHEHHGHGSHAHQQHSDACGCGHAHMPAPEQLQGAWSWRKAIPIALAVGIRPCTGAILVLIFALSQGILWAGVIATFAMAIGTAITVSVLAALAAGSRDLAAYFPGTGGVWADRVKTTAAFAGSFLVFALGAAFFFASLKGIGPL